MAVNIILVIMATCLTVATYNIQGHGADRLAYLKNLCTNHDFVLVQEHWYFRSELTTLESKLGVNIHGTSAMSENALLCGRPFGGCAIVWEPTLACEITPIDSTLSRVCAVQVKSKDFDFILCNIYMPCDTVYDHVNIQEFNDVLDEVSRICHTCDSNHIIIGGDFNTDLTRINSAHTQNLKPYLANENLKYCDDSMCCNVDYTYTSKINGVQSTLDHFLVSENLFTWLNKYSVSHDGDNLSDHSVVTLCINWPIVHFEEPSVESSPKLKWDCANDIQIDDYKHTLDCLLAHVVIPWDAIKCNNCFCSEHNISIDTFHNDIVTACIEASFATIPVSKSGKSKALPGWNDCVEEHPKQPFFGIIFGKITILPDKVSYSKYAKEPGLNTTK
jgi:exonuclease III